MTKSRYGRRAAEMERALQAPTEIQRLERRIVAIPAKDWEAFEAWARRPPRRIAALERLARGA